MNVKNLFYVLVLLYGVILSCKTTTELNEQEAEKKYYGQTPPGLTPKVFAPGVISTELFEYKILLRPNSNEVYYETWNGQTQKSISYIINWVDSKWSEPELFLSVNAFNEELGCFSVDGNILLYSSNEPNGGYAYDIKYFVWENDSWSSGKSLSASVNTSNREQSPSMSSNGNLYYYSEYKNGTGIFMARKENDVYSQSVALSDSINQYEAHNPFIASDESYIIFTSYRDGGLGDADLYISFKNQDGTWSKAKNVGAPINSTSQDDFAFVSPDGKYLFFASDRESKGVTDIYFVSSQILESLR